MVYYVLLPRLVRVLDARPLLSQTHVCICRKLIKGRLVTGQIARSSNFCRVVFTVFRAAAAVIVRAVTISWGKKVMTTIFTSAAMVK